MCQQRHGATGASRSRIQDLISRKCRCHRQTCYQQLKHLVNRLLEFLVIFWKFTKGVQDQYVGAFDRREHRGVQDIETTIIQNMTVCFLNQVEQVVRACKGKRRAWYLLGEQLSPKCCVAVLGIGNSRLQRVEQGRGDRRLSTWGRVTCTELTQPNMKHLVLGCFCEPLHGFPRVSQ